MYGVSLICAGDDSRLLIFEILSILSGYSLGREQRFGRNQHNFKLPFRFLLHVTQ